MKKALALFTVLFVCITCIFATGNSRKDIDKFFKEYEDYVVAYEKAYKSNNMIDLLKLSEQTVEFTEAAEDIQDSDAWTLKDYERLINLQKRLNKAMGIDTSAATADALGGFDLGSFGF